MIGPSLVAHRDGVRQIWAGGFFWEEGSVLAVVKGCEEEGCEGGSCYDPVFSRCFRVPWTYPAGVYIGHPFRLAGLPCDLPHDRPNGLAYDRADDPADGPPYDHRYGRPCGHECGLLDGLQDDLPTDHQRDQPSDRLHDPRYDRPNGLPHDLLRDLQCGQPNGLPHDLRHVLLYDPPADRHYASGGVGICWEHNCRWRRAEYGLGLWGVGDCEWPGATDLCYTVGRIRPHHISELHHLRICNEQFVRTQIPWL